MAKRSKRDKTEEKLSMEKRKCPWTCFRPLFGTISMLLFLICLHSLIYVTFVASKTPDCSKCDERKEDKLCHNYCDITVDDFVFVYNIENRIDLLAYMGVVLFLRCFAFIGGFVGVSTDLFYVMIVYLVLHFGLIITFIATIVFYAVEGKPLFEYVFGRTTTSIVCLSLEYSLELILLIVGLTISWKFFRIKYSKESDEEKKPQKRQQLTVRSDLK